MTMFNLNSLMGFDFITRHVWLSYSQPTDIRFTNIGNIPGSIKVSMYLETTFNTMERITFPVSPVNMPTDRTFLAGIPWVNGDNRFTKGLRFVSQELFDLVKAPVIEFSGKFYSFSALNSYAGKVFNGEHIKRHSCNFLRDTVINIRNKPFFFSANFLKKFFSRPSAFVLKFRSKVCVLCSHVFDWFSIEKPIIRSNCNVNNSPINSKNIVTNRFRRLFMDGYMQIKSILLFIIAQCGCTKFPRKILLIIFRNWKRSSYSTFNRRESNGFLVKADITNPFIIPNCRVLFTFWNFFKSNSFKGFTRNIPDPLKDRAWKFRMLFPYRIISFMVNRHFTMCMVYKPVFNNLIENMVTESHCLAKSFFIIIRQFQFQFNRSIHIHKLLLTDVKSLLLQRSRYAPPPFRMGYPLPLHSTRFR